MIWPGPRWESGSAGRGTSGRLCRAVEHRAPGLVVEAAEPVVPLRADAPDDGLRPLVRRSTIGEPRPCLTAHHATLIAAFSLGGHFTRGREVVSQFSN